MRIARSGLQTKAQASTIDFILSFTIIIIALLLTARLIITAQDTSDFDDVREQAVLGSQILVSEGLPTNWTASTVIRPGILSDNQLNMTKLNVLSSMTYDDSRSRIAASYDYYVYFVNKTSVLNLSGCGIGSSKISVDSSCVPSFGGSSNLIRLERLIAHNNSIVTMVVILWD